MWLPKFLQFLALMTLCQCQSIYQQVCSTNTFMTNLQPGADIIIGGLFEIRTSGINGSGCGKPLSDTMQIFESARFAVNFLNNCNNGSGYISGLKFGLEAYDTCSSAINALNALEKLYPQSTSSNPFCTINNRVIAGTIGPLSSLTTISTAILAGQLPVSLISPASTAPELSDKFKYPTFLRTVPSYSVFATVIVKLLQQLQWQNILVIYTDEVFGRTGYEQLLMATHNHGLCVTYALGMDTKGNKDSYKTTLSAIGSVSSPVAVLMAPNSLSKIILQAVDEVPSLANMQWILGDIDMTNDFTSIRRVHGAMVVVPRSQTIDEFRDYFIQLQRNPQNNIGNPWFQDWFEETYGCSLTGTGNTCPTPTATQFVQSPWAVPTMKAVFAYAEMIRTVCKNEGGGLCTSLTTMTPNEFNRALFDLDFTLPTTFPNGLKGQRIKFDTNGNPETSDFTVFNYNNRAGNFMFEEVYRFESDVFTLTMQPTLYDSTRSNILTNNPTAKCADLGCENCLLPRRSVTYRYQPGDIVIASLINAHESGSSPFTCGIGRVSQLAALVAAEWAVSQYKIKNPTKLQNVTLGSLVADVCPDTAVALDFLKDLLSGNNQLVDLTGAVIPYSNIQAFVDETGSDQTEIISPIISEYQIPEVLTSVTTSKVSQGGVNTPYFTRVVPSDKVIYTAISSLLQRLGWKYIQVATHKSGEFREMAETFTRIAAGYGICVVDMVDYFGDGMMEPYNRTVSSLLNNRDTQIVVVFGSMVDVRGLLLASGQRGVSRLLQLVVGTESWGTNPEYFRGIESFAADTIVIDLEMLPDSAFSSYLQRLNRDQIVASPFLRELFEVTNQCVLDFASQSVYTRRCTSTDTFINVYQGKVPYVIQSINAVASKLHDIIADLCNNTYSGMCSGFQFASDIGSRLSKKLADVPKSGGFGTKNGDAITDILFFVFNQGWRTVANFNTESQTLVSVDTTLLLNYQVKLSTCAGECMMCQYMFTMQTSVYNMGDWLIAGAFGVSNSGPERLQPYICSDVKTANGPQFTMAMLYALQQVNTGKAPVSVRGVTFGNLIVDHCDNPGRANLLISDIYADLFINRMDVDQRKILAWITDTNESVNETVRILDPLNVVTMSPSATSNSLMNYKTFFRTIPGDPAAATALVMIVQALKYNYIQVVYSANSYGRDGFNLLMTASEALGICIINKIEFSVNTTNIVTQLLGAQSNVVIMFTSEADTDALLTSIASNSKASSSLLILLPKPNKKIIQQVGSLFKNPIISLQLQQVTLSDYNAYINSSPITNPYFAQYYMKIMICNVPGYSMYNSLCANPLQPITSKVNYEEDNFILPTIDAVYAVVDALDRTVKDYCGANYIKPCSNFLAAVDKRQKFNSYLNNVNFVDDGKRTFKFLAREGGTIYDILQSDPTGTYSKVGSYSGQSLNLTDSAALKYENVSSKCSPCTFCSMKALNFSYTVGDIYLAGMFDVHKRSLSPFTCGDIKTLHGFLLLEAFHYAIEQVNSKQGQFKDILRGTRLGGVGLDSCESDVRAGHLISNIHSGFVTLAKESTIIYPSNIDVYIGTYASTTSSYIARILTDLKIPQISYGAGSQDLSKKEMYPYFYRTVPTDYSQVEAMLKLMDKLNIRYVQVLYEDNSNGLSAMTYFLERASTYSICVAEKVPYPDLGIVSAETSSTVVAKLLEKPAANTVVTFLSTVFINSVLMTIQSSDKTKNKFRFVGSDSWAANQDATQGAEAQSADSITIGLDAYDIQDFGSYISSRNLASSKDNPWFAEYFQRILNCYISKTNTLGYPNACPSSTVSLINSVRYQQDPDVVYVINAVYAAAFAIHETLMDLCGANYATVCQTYYSATNHRSVIRDNLAGVTFTDPVGKDFMFVNRSGVASYRFYSIDSGISGYSYKQIGSYNMTTATVSLSNAYSSTWNSDCSRPDSCAECPLVRDRGLRYVFQKSTQNMIPTVVAFFDIHKQGVDPFHCGDINVAGFQQLLTFFYTLENIIMNNKYRVLAIDTCSNSLRVDQDLYGLLDGTGLCNTEYNNGNSVSIANIGSVITVGELNTVAGSRVLELPGVTYLSPDALSPWLDDKQHLVRTIAPVSAMMKTLVALLSALNWNYVDTVYEHAAMSMDQFYSFASYANLAGVCRGSNVMISTGSMSSDIQKMLTSLNGDKGSKAVILLGSYKFVQDVLAAANAMSIADLYVWVLGGGWSLTSDALKELVPVGVELRFITIQRLSYMVDNFKSYMNSLTYAKVPSNVNVPQEWFDEFYQMVFNCTLSNAAKPINIDKMMCNTSKQFSSLNITPALDTLNIIAATYAAISGLNNCGGSCSSPINNASVHMNILQNVLKVQWTTDFVKKFQLSGQVKPPILKFDQENRWWDSGYLFKYIKVKKSASGGFDVQEVELVHGDFNQTENDISKIKSTVGITSACNRKDACGCTFNGIEKPEPLVSESFKPTGPRNYYYYHDNGEQQYMWPVWAVVVAIITSVGLIVDVVLFLILIFKYPVRSGTSLLGYMTIIGIMGIYAINFAFFVHASEASCGARRFLMGVVYMIALAPLLIKALDNWGFGQSNSQKQVYSGIFSPWVLLIVAIIIVLVQCIIPIIWLILVNPTASDWSLYAFARHDNWWCDPPDSYDTGLVLSFIFVMLIVLVTVIFSAMTYDNDKNNFESRWILLTCIVTAGCFLVWMIVSTYSVPHVRDVAVTIGNLVNATFLMITMPLRKSMLLCRHLRRKEKDVDTSEAFDEANGHLKTYESFENPMHEFNLYNK